MPDGSSAGSPQVRGYPKLNSHIQPEGHAKKEVYVGIDAHKDKNVFGSGPEGRAPAEFIGACSADLNRTVTFIRIRALFIALNTEVILP